MSAGFEPRSSTIRHHRLRQEAPNTDTARRVADDPLGEGGIEVIGAIVLLGAAALAIGQAMGLLWLTVGFGALRLLGQGSRMRNCANPIAQGFDRSGQIGSEA